MEVQLAPVKRLKQAQWKKFVLSSIFFEKSAISNYLVKMVFILKFNIFLLRQFYVNTRKIYSALET